MSRAKLLTNRFSCCEVIVRGTGQKCGNAAAFEWEGRNICRVHAPRRNCSICNRIVVLWEAKVVAIGGRSTVTLCPECKKQHDRKPFTLEALEKPSPRRPSKHGKLCPVCYDLPHRRAKPACSGCGKPPGPTK